MVVKLKKNSAKHGYYHKGVNRGFERDTCHIICKLNKISGDS